MKGKVRVQQNIMYSRNLQESKEIFLGVGKTLYY